jgi:hypothetical protein
VRFSNPHTFSRSCSGSVFIFFVHQYIEVMSTKEETSYFRAPTKQFNDLDWWSMFTLTRLHKFPAGTTVFVAPCSAYSVLLNLILRTLMPSHQVWGLLMAAHGIEIEPTPNILRMSAMWYMAQLINHAAACVWNDICDRDIDRLVGTSNLSTYGNSARNAKNIISSFLRAF